MLMSKLLSDNGLPPLVCRVRRIVKRRNGIYEYGCQFVDLSDATRDRLFKAVITFQHQFMKRRSNYDIK